MFNTRRPIDNYEESDSEDSSMDDFIDDEPLDDAAVEKNELRNTLRVSWLIDWLNDWLVFQDLYKYDRRRFAGETSVTTTDQWSHDGNSAKLRIVGACVWLGWFIDW